MCPAIVIITWLNVKVTKGGRRRAEGAKTCLQTGKEMNGTSFQRGKIWSRRLSAVISFLAGD